MPKTCGVVIARRDAHLEQRIARKGIPTVVTISASALMAAAGAELVIVIGCAATASAWLLCILSYLSLLLPVPAAALRVRRPMS